MKIMNRLFKYTAPIELISKAINFGAELYCIPCRFKTKHAKKP